MKIITLAFLFLLTYCKAYTNSVYSKEDIQKLSNIKSKIQFNGELFYSEPLRYFKKIQNPHLIYNENLAASITQISPLRNYYDYQSHGTPLQIYVQVASPDNIHAIYTYSSQASGWTDRTVQYFTSIDRGASWSFAGNVPSTGRSGFGYLSFITSGVAAIACNVDTPTPQTNFFVDAFPGLGSFAQLQPGSGAGLNARLTPTYAPFLPNKFVFISSKDSLKYGAGRSITNNDFTPIKSLGISSSDSYAIASSGNGNEGIAYIDYSSSNFGDVYFTESTDDGISFSTPIKIFDADFTTDSLAGFKGISIIYKNNNPCVAFETVKQTRDEHYFPGAPSKIRFWTNTLNGSDPNRSIVIADKNRIPYAPARGTTDMEAPICRPSLGKNSSFDKIFCAMVVQSSATGGDDTTSYNDIYLSYANQDASAWSAPQKITPESPRNDWSYASIAPINDKIGNTEYVNIIAQRDIVPGSNVNHTNPNTNSVPCFIRTSYTVNGTIAAPNLLSPFNGATNVSTTPLMTWNGAGEFYTIQFSASSNFNTPLYSFSGDNLQAQQYQVLPGLFNPNTTYYWRVMTYAFGVNGTWAAPFSFHIGPVEINPLTTEIPKEFKLYNTYPNPFNPSAKVKFDIPKNTNVNINVFDVNGRLVNEFLNSNLQAGSYVLEFNGNELSSGIYYLKISADNFFDARKMILIK
jgi:hypothetical protein